MRISVGNMAGPSQASLLQPSIGLVEDSLRKRYFAKLTVNLLAAPLGFLTQMLALRVTGPEGYGTYSLLNGFFQGLINFLDAGASTCFYTKLSQRLGDVGLKHFNWRLFLVLCLAVALLGGLAFMSGSDRWLWPGKHASHVWLAMACGLALWASQILGRMVDAHGLTVAGERTRLLQKAVSLSLLAALFWAGWHSLDTFFGYNLAIAFLLGAGWWWVLRRGRIPAFPRKPMGEASPRRYLHEFWDYSQPLLVYSVVGFLAVYGELWLLERFAGTVQQGFYGLATQMSAVCFLFVGAMTPLFMRDFAIAHAQTDLERMAALFNRCLPMFYAIAVFFSVFLCLEAEKVARIVGGARFTQAGGALAIMALYPIHQTYGQLNGSVFYATGRTDLYRNIGLVATAVGFLLTFWFVAPTRFGGLALGSAGLALKMVVIQFFAVNVQLYWNARLLKLSFSRFLKHQVLVVLAFGLLAWLSRALGERLGVSPWLALGVSGCAYTIGCLGAVWRCPYLLNLSHDEMKSLIRQCLNRVRS